MRGTKNMKWEWIVYFLICSGVINGCFYGGWVYMYGTWQVTQPLVLFFGVALLAGASVGYYAALRFQRRIDMLHLGIIQLSKGNLSERLQLHGADSFEQIYRDFNEMSDSLEQKIKLMQKLSEEHVLLREQSNEEAVLEERRRLARDLHDTVSQQLFAIHLSASSMPKVMDKDIGKAKAVLQQLIKMSYHAQRQMRGLIAQLRPIELEGRTLSNALEKWFPDYCRQNGLQGSLSLQLREQISEAKERQLFMIIQEGMANIVKHASAKNVSLSLHDMGHQYAMQLTDDGQGFDRTQVKPSSYGLQTMHERAQKLGGDMELLSKPGSGTLMKVYIPKFQD